MEFGENKVRGEEFEGDRTWEKERGFFLFFFFRRCSCVEEDEITVMIKKIIIYININNFLLSSLYSCPSVFFSLSRKDFLIVTPCLALLFESVLIPSPVS